MVRTPLRLPTTDVAVPPTFEPRQLPLVSWHFFLLAPQVSVLSLAKTLGVLSFTPLTMLQACAQAVDFKVGHHFGEGHLGGNLRMAAKTKTKPARLTDAQIEIVGQMNDLSFENPKHQGR